jgi:hypothetical protein
LKKDGSKLINTQIGQQTDIKWDKNYTKESRTGAEHERKRNKLGSVGWK